MTDRPYVKRAWAWSKDLPTRDGGVRGQKPDDRRKVCALFGCRVGTAEARTHRPTDMTRTQPRAFAPWPVSITDEARCGRGVAPVVSIRIDATTAIKPLVSISCHDAKSTSMCGQMEG